MKNSARLPFIDSLRGIASLWVMLFHFFNAFGDYSLMYVPNWLHAFFETGDLGVFIFFVLSGFVISLSINGKDVSLRFFLKFAWRRLIRLDIPYWIVIILTGLVMSVLFHYNLSDLQSPDWSTYIINMLYLDNLTGTRSIVAVGWTLQYEIQFYLFFAALLLVCNLIQQKWAIHLSVFFGATFLLSLLYWFSEFPFHLKGIFLDYWFYFLLGALAQYTLYNRQKPFVWLFILSVFLSFIHAIYFSELKTVVAILTTLFIFMAGRYSYYHWLDNRVLLFLGKISYSLYLLHPLLGNRLIRFVSSKFDLGVIAYYGVFLGTIIITITFVYIFYKLIEEPSILFARRVVLNS